jgi:hypothetical protein
MEKNTSFLQIFARSVRKDIFLINDFLVLENFTKYAIAYIFDWLSLEACVILHCSVAFLSSCMKSNLLLDCQTSF